jgi:hypothetical protein
MAENNLHIKDLIGTLQTDILFEKILCHLPNSENIIYEPKGIFNKDILKDVERITAKKRHLFIEVNRPGIYDTLPKGLFHNKLDDSNNTDGFFEQVESEKKAARKFFLPFDSEIFAGHTLLERAAIKHYSQSYDSDILISFIIFFHLQDEIDFLSLLELLAIDLVSFLAINDINEDLIYRRLTNLLHQEITPFDLIRNLIEQTQGNSMIVRLINAISFAAGSAGKIVEIREILEYIIQLKVTTKQTKQVKSYLPECNTPTNSLNKSMNLNTQSLIMGNCFLDEVDVVNISIEIDPTKMFLMSNLMNGSIHKLIRAFLSFFIDYHTHANISFEIKPANRTSQTSYFQLEKIPDETFRKMQNLKNILIRHFIDLNFQDQSIHTGIPVSTILLLKDYFISFTKLISAGTNQYAYLNMNTKI